jgi:protein TonB
MEPVKAMAVRMFEDRPAIVSAPPAPEQKPLPAPPVKRTPPPILVAAPKAETAAPATFAVVPQPEPTPAPATAAPSSVVGQVTAARFDADYLNNPKPVYPSASRRLGEEGKVVLRVRVSADGFPLSVDVKQSSGFARLDDAARAAVEQWRFVPAKHGADAIESTVLVPLNFALRTN